PGRRWDGLVAPLITRRVVRNYLSRTALGRVDLVHARQRVLVVQSTEYCFGVHRAEVVESMPRLRQWHARTRGRIGNAGAPRLSEDVRDCNAPPRFSASAADAIPRAER